MKWLLGLLGGLLVAASSWVWSRLKRGGPVESSDPNRVARVRASNQGVIAGRHRDMADEIAEDRAELAEEAEAEEEEIDALSLDQLVEIANRDRPDGAGHE